MNAQSSSEGVVDAVAKCITRLHRITKSRHVRLLWSRVGLSLNALDNMPELVLRPHKERIKDHFETVNSKFLLDWMNGDVTDRESSWNRMQSVVAQLKSGLGHEVTYRMERMMNEVAQRDNSMVQSSHSLTAEESVDCVIDIQCEPYILAQLYWPHLQPNVNQL